MGWREALNRFLKLGGNPELAKRAAQKEKEQEMRRSQAPVHEPPPPVKPEFKPDPNRWREDWKLSGSKDSYEHWVHHHAPDILTGGDEACSTCELSFPYGTLEWRPHKKDFCSRGCSLWNVTSTGGVMTPEEIEWVNSGKKLEDFSPPVKEVAPPPEKKEPETLPPPAFTGYVVGSILTLARQDAFKRRDFDAYSALRSEEDYTLLGQSPRDPVSAATILEVEGRYPNIRLGGCRKYLGSKY